MPAGLTASVTRVESQIQDYSLPDDYNNVVLIGKHLCGPGTDAGIQFVWKHKHRMLGSVFATCCCCKLVKDSSFAEQYFGAADCEPCQAVLPEPQGGVQLSPTPHLLRPGAGTAAEPRHEAEADDLDEQDERLLFSRVLPEVARATSWRSNQMHQSDTYAGLTKHSEFFES